MKIALFILTMTVCASRLCAWWLVDDSIPGTTSRVNVNDACKIETTGEVARFLTEQEGKLIVFFETKSPEPVRLIKAQIKMGQSVWLPVADGGNVNIASISSIRTEQRDGMEVCILRGRLAELGTVTDPVYIKEIKARTKYPADRPQKYPQ